MALGSTQPLTEMSTRNVSLGGIGGRCVGLTTLPPSCADCLEFGILCLLEPLGPVQSCNVIALPLPLSKYICRFSIHGTVHRGMISSNNQQDAT